MRSSRLASALALVLAGAASIAVPSVGLAQATLITGLGGLAGVGENSLAPNDDGSTTLIGLATEFPAGLRFYGRLYPGLFVNNNGNVSFEAATGTYTPNPFPFPPASNPLIALWWGDADTRNRTGVGDSNLVYWDLTPGRIVVTWLDVGYYNQRNTSRFSGQMILTDASAFGIAGAFDVEFRYNRCEWVAGTASGDTSGNGLCEAGETTCVPAQAGFDAADGTNFLTLPGSRTNAVRNLCTTSNVGDPGVWRFQVRPSGVTVCGNNTRELGEACDDGNVINGDGCNERCAVELPPGSDCMDDLQCRSGFCTDGVCCGSRCDSQCEACAEAGSRGTCRAVSGAPRGSRAGCAFFGDTCGGSCNGALRTACTFPASGTSCDDGSACSVMDVCSGTGTCAGVGLTCDDGLTCTADSCSVGICTNAIVAGSCVIDGACVAAGAFDPTNDCMVCDPARATRAYSPRLSGATCDDGTLCTETDVCDGAGSCAGTAITCADDGIACTAPVCEPITGLCSNVVTSGCLIGGACIAAGTLDPSNPCLSCDPSKSTTSYSNLEAGVRCAEPMCMGATLTLARSCDGAGTCAAPTTEICASGCADASMCRGGCSTNAECPSDRHCEAGICRLDLPDGDPCDRDAQCQSNECVDGVCCNVACDGLCEACDLAGSVGACAPHASGTDPDDECTDALSCDGARMCEVPVGTDGGMPDGGVTVDGGLDGGGLDGGGLDGGGLDGSSGDAGRVRTPGISGGACGCSAIGTGRNSGLSIGLLMALGLGLALRRRR